MSKQLLKRHNPLGLDISKPDWVNSEGVAWWGIDMGDTKDGYAVRVKGKDIDEYVILKDGGIIYSTHSLEQLAWKFTEFKLRRTL